VPFSGAEFSHIIIVTRRNPLPETASSRLEAVRETAQRDASWRSMRSTVARLYSCYLGRSTASDHAVDVKRSYTSVHGDLLYRHVQAGFIFSDQPVSVCRVLAQADFRSSDGRPLRIRCSSLAPVLEEHHRALSSLMIRSVHNGACIPGNFTRRRRTLLVTPLQRSASLYVSGHLRMTASLARVSGSVLLRYTGGCVHPHRSVSRDKIIFRGRVICPAPVFSTYISRGARRILTLTMLSLDESVTGRRVAVVFGRTVSFTSRTPFHYPCITNFF